MSRLTRDGTAGPVSRNQFSGTHGDRGTSIFPGELTTSRIGNLTRLMHTLLCDHHTYIRTYIQSRLWSPRGTCTKVNTPLLVTKPKRIRNRDKILAGHNQPRTPEKSFCISVTTMQCPWGTINSYNRSPASTLSRVLVIFQDLNSRPNMLTIILPNRCRKVTLSSELVRCLKKIRTRLDLLSMPQPEGGKCQNV